MLDLLVRLNVNQEAGLQGQLCAVYTKFYSLLISILNRQCNSFNLFIYLFIYLFNQFKISLCLKEIFPRFDEGHFRSPHYRALLLSLFQFVMGLFLVPLTIRVWYQTPQDQLLLISDVSLESKQF